MQPNIIVVYQSLAFRQPWEGATFFWFILVGKCAIEVEDEDEEVEPIFPRSGVLHYSLAPMVCCNT